MNIYQLYALYGAITLGATIVKESNFKQIVQITENDLDATKGKLADELNRLLKNTFQEHEYQPDFILVPLDTCVFTRGDLAEMLMKTDFQIKTTWEEISQDYTSWVQSMDHMVTFHGFWYSLNQKNKASLDAEDF